MRRREATTTALLIPDRDGAVMTAERLAAAAHLTSSLEYLFDDRNSTEETSVLARTTTSAVRSSGERDVRLRSGGNPSTTPLHLTRALAATVLLAPGRRRRLFAGLLTTACTCLLHRRQRYGSDGADQMALLVQTSCALARAGNRDPRLVDACLTFQAAQATMAYVISGCAKFASSSWRRGTALEGILRTRVYGDRRAFSWCLRHPRQARRLTRLVAFAECGFVAAFVGGGRWAPVVVLFAGVFHAVTARLMGLGRFWWAFAATYPAVMYVARSERKG